MAVLSAQDRKDLPDDKFAGPHRSFPLTDKGHDRAAITDASKSEHAGNLSHGQAEHIKEEAREKLHGGDPKGGADPKAAVAKMHPEHVHRLVQDAKAGKYGPEAQKHAQAAMASTPGPGDPAADGQQSGDGDDSQSQMGARRIFGSPGGPAGPSMPGASQPDDDQDDQQGGGPVNARAIFGRGR